MTADTSPPADNHEEREARLARLSAALEASERRLQRLEVLYNVGRALNSTLDLSAVLSQTMALAAEALDAQGSSLMLLDPEKHELVFEVPHGEAAGALKQLRMRLDEGIAGWVATHGEAVLLNDVRSDPRHAGRIDSATRFTTRSLLCVPLQVGTGGQTRTIGVLEVVNKREGHFTEDDLEWLRILGGQAAIAVENARLYENLRAQRDRIIKAQEEVRHELARNLHDGAAQVLGALILNLDNVRRLLKASPRKVAGELDYLENLARQAHQQVRQLLFELRPIILETQGLVPALQAYAQQIRAEAPFEVSLVADPIPPIAREAGAMIFAVVQEAVNNAKKHAQARYVWLRLHRVNGFIQIEVEDNGVGFDVGQTMATYDQRSSLGLINMRERATLLDGQLDIFSPRPGGERGTLVRLTVPLARIAVAGEG
jgi:signal transduction histidine kinase